MPCNLLISLSVITQCLIVPLITSRPEQVVTILYELSCSHGLPLYTASQYTPLRARYFQQGLAVQSGIKTRKVGSAKLRLRLSGDSLKEKCPTGCLQRNGPAADARVWVRWWVNQARHQVFRAGNTFQAKYQQLWNKASTHLDSCAHQFKNGG